MKFKGQQDILTHILIIAYASIFTWSLATSTPTSPEQVTTYIIMATIMVLILGLLLWVNFGTTYEICEDQIKYKSGPLRGAISIEDIHELIVGETQYVGFKPATARKGIIVKYEKYNEIYISPADQKKFVDQLKSIKPLIKVINRT